MRLTKFGMVPAIVLAASAVALPAVAQTSSSGNTSREMQRGVPGADVDVNMNANGRARNNGVPGVDVDVRNRADGTAGRAGSVDTRTSGAAGSGDTMGQRAARADRN